MSSKKKTVFKGCATALITPFSKGAVDYESLDRLIEYQISEGADALVVCGTTGESATLDDDERREVIYFSVTKVAGRIPVIAGTGCNNINKAVELSKYADECGADAVMTVTPYYNKASATGLIKSFVKIADSVKIPVMIYNVPSRTGIDIPIHVYKELAQHDNICAVKEASGNIVTVEKILYSCANMLDVYSGNDDMILPVLAVGGIGVVSVVSNILPKKVHDLCAEFESRRINESAQIQLELLDIINAMFSEVNPIPVKSAVALLGACSDEMRLPLCALDAHKLNELKNVLKKYDLEIK
ncbi:MAG: 4-hydroxy-tetrahydrodipicolinate synthase [Ruminococcaceae bacterium]|nr:4-hydroxy-tetrahydrodipicolinate synthase [Oscillospiraceae bacterium]